MKKRSRQRPLNGQKLAKRLFKMEKNKLKKALKAKEKSLEVDLISIRPHPTDLPEVNN